MTGVNIIARYNLQVDDASELSPAEELSLLNEVYYEVADDRDWEWLKATASGNTSTSVPYIALPTDFKKVLPNKDSKSVVFVGTSFQEYEVIPFSSRREHRNEGGFCYIDVPNQRLVFTKQPTSVEAVEYDYILRPPALSLITAPLVSTDRMGECLAYGMASRFYAIEQTDKGNSYANENKVEFLRILSDLATEDANVKLSI